MRRRGLLLLGLLLPAPVAAQQVRTAVVPRDLTVGDVFQVVVQVAPVASGTVLFPDSLALPPDLENAGRRVLRQDTVAEGRRWTAAYPVTGWRPGRYSLPPARVGLEAGGRTLAAAAVFPEVMIRSVLPADTAGVQPQPPRDVLGASRSVWPWLLLGALLALLAALAFLWYRRRRRRIPAPVPIPAASPRETALRELEAARSSGALEAGDWKRFYSDVSGALRSYVAALDPALGPDLTSSELALVLRAPDTTVLHALLHRADLVKFARLRPGAELALADWDQARAWVASYGGTQPVARAA